MHPEKDVAGNPRGQRATLAKEPLYIPSEKLGDVIPGSQEYCAILRKAKF